MADRRPDTRQLVLHVLERQDERIKVGICGVVQQLVEPVAMSGDDLFERRQHVFGRNLRKARQ